MIVARATVAGIWAGRARGDSSSGGRVAGGSQGPHRLPQVGQLTVAAGIDGHDATR